MDRRLSVGLTTVARVETWSRAQVLAAASDDASRRAATPLTATRVWSESGRAVAAATGSADALGTGEAGDGTLLWGRCRGSATYAVAVRPGRSYACSCPSRKAPCKHALALLLRWADGLVPPGDAPGWATSALAVAPAGRAGGAPDLEAAAARAAERRERVATGLDDLDRWLHDQVRTGLSTWERGAWALVEAVAARMVDAQAPGVAGMLRGLPGLPARSEGSPWPEQLLDALAGLHLLVVAHRGLDRLPDDLAATVRARVGYPVAKAAVLARPVVVDRWQALGAVDSLEGRLETRRVWLWGTTTRTWALLLSFAVPGAGLDESVEVGQVLHAAVHRYPGAAEQRVLLGEQWPLTASTPVPLLAPALLAGPAETVAAAGRRWADQVAADPWASRMPAVLHAVPVPPPRPGEAWHLADPDGSAVRLSGLPREPWPLLAASGGDPVEVFGEWGPGGFVPLRLLDHVSGPDVALDAASAPRLGAVA